jgi:nucleotide-binding universal stress UspA family protein
MKTQMLVPLHTYPMPNENGIALHAAAVARHLDADVHALVLKASIPRVSSAFGNMLIDVPAMIGDAKEKCRLRGEELVQAMRDETGPSGISLRTTEIECLPVGFGDAVADHARYHDLVMVGLGPGNVALQATAETAIFGSGRPTLLVPEEMPVATFRHVMIGWDGSRVAARAVADARDFLRRAQVITIASVTDEKPLPEEAPGSRLADYLTRHEIRTTVARVQSQGRPIAQALQEHAREIGADMLVVGAFGHSRIRDFVLGGATSGILRQLRLPVLMSH